MPEKKRPTKESIEKVPSTSSAVLLLIGVSLDTTWRMFVPIVGLAILGVWLDNTIGTKPWLTISGIIVGIVIALALIIQQINRNDK